VGENVRGLTNWNGGLVFDEVCTELENLGYQVAPVIIPACGVGAPHRRERIWFVAYANGPEQRNNARANNREAEKVWRQNKSNVSRELSSDGIAVQPKGVRLQESSEIGEMERTRSKLTGKRTNWDKFPTQSPICSGNDGLSGELDGITFPKWRNESIKAYGNAIVPQVAYQIFKALELCK
jgi:DNA (cytosine-5)-methyltransferase 1